MDKKIKIKRNKGMTYIELIVVLSIFSILSGISIYSYGKFQDNIDIKNLASDVALKIVEAQKSSLSGLLPPGGRDFILGWKPSYGVYFDISGANKGIDNKNFIYFTDLNNNGNFDDSYCTGECLNKVTITKSNTISRLGVVYENAGSPSCLNDLTITFSRPNSGAIIRSSAISIPPDFPISYVVITIASPSGATSAINLYPSGRVQIVSPAPSFKCFNPDGGPVPIDPGGLNP